MKRKVILATGNKNKLREVKEIAEKMASDIEFISMTEGGCTLNDIEENGSTFEENSFIKSRAVSLDTSSAAVADDSGLIVDALSDSERNIFYPGIISARFFDILKEIFVSDNAEAREKYEFLYTKVKELCPDIREELENIDREDIKKDEKNYKVLLKIMENTEKRDCRFVCCATYFDGERNIKKSFSGACEGRLMRAPVITGNGFGYDPVFFVKKENECDNGLKLDRAMSLLSDEEKNSISHRGKAMRKMIAEI